MAKEIDILIKSLRMTLLCFAFVMSGTSVSASMPSHDMSQMMSHTASQESDITAVHNDCASQQAVSVQLDDCCQADDCKNSCAANISMIIVAISKPVEIKDFSDYAAYIDHSRSRLSDPSNPPPIS